MTKIKKTLKEKISNHKELIYIISAFIFFMIFLESATQVLKSKYDTLENIITNKSYLFCTMEILLYLLAVAIPTILLLFFFKHKITISFKNEKKYYKNLFLSILLGFVIQPIGMGISGISTLIFGENAVSSVTESLSSDCNAFLVALSVSILPALLEEILFRDLFFSKLKNKYSVLISAIISGLLFGIFHMNLQQMIYAICYGIFFSYIFNKTGNILDTMVIHFTIDFSQLLLAISLLKLENTGFYQEVEATTTDPSIGLGVTIFSIFAFIIFIPLAYNLYNKYSNIKIEREEIENEFENELENKIENKIKE